MKEAGLDIPTEGDTAITAVEAAITEVVKPGASSGPVEGIEESETEIQDWRGNVSAKFLTFQ